MVEIAARQEKGVGRGEEREEKVQRTLMHIRQKKSECV